MLGTDHIKADVIAKRHFDYLTYYGSVGRFKCHSAKAFRAVPVLASQGRMVLVRGEPGI